MNEFNTALCELEELMGRHQDVYDAVLAVLAGREVTLDPCLDALMREAFDVDEGFDFVQAVRDRGGVPLNEPYDYATGCADAHACDEAWDEFDDFEGDDDFDDLDGEADDDWAFEDVFDDVVGEDEPARVDWLATVRVALIDVCAAAVLLCLPFILRSGWGGDASSEPTPSVTLCAVAHTESAAPQPTLQRTLAAAPLAGGATWFSLNDKRESTPQLAAPLAVRATLMPAWMIRASETVVDVYAVHARARARGRCRTDPQAQPAARCRANGDRGPPSGSLMRIVS